MTHGATDMLFKEVNACAELEKFMFVQEMHYDNANSHKSTHSRVTLTTTHFNSVTRDLLLLNHNCLINSFAQLAMD